MKLYPHRDRAEAARALAAFDRWLPPRGRILDVACGAGRHLSLLLERGRDAYGIDRSWTLLEEAPVPRERLIRGDMRHLPFAAGSMNGLLSAFTSFGYFEGRSAHRNVLRELARVAAPGAVLILDVANPEALRSCLVPRSERTVEGHDVVEERRIVRMPDGERVVKEVTVRDGAGGEVERYHEEVALFEPDDLAVLLAEAGWDPAARLGDYDGGEWSPQSPRQIAVASRRRP